MLENKKVHLKNLRSIFISKFCFLSNKSISVVLRINYYLIIKRKEKNKILFFFVILLLILSTFPKILKVRKKLKRFKQSEFLAFEFGIKLLDIFKFLNIYLPITDIIENLYFKYNHAEYRLTIKHFPVITEVDKLCEANTLLLEFIQDYNLILKFKMSTINWYQGECLIRSLNVPFVSSNRI